MKKSGDRLHDDKQKFYVCGQCKTKIYYLVTDSPPDKCPECGWKHKAKKKSDIPRNIKLNLNNY